ncbi:type VII secretion protein EssB [Sporolactobacillus sp. THM19-2]|uniref:type VII secretion protein EssB n=1 Tax=Sporolactobacillus sp. THM19-2 TaxID=2511171 RepID=UPI00101F6C53|nr:type VII secretion protein EssB [Sporolactobacillus sp. THM19-2]RYL87260.1 type VII secretion protein EssB [Sporolactobacillus sp. THM19-2]
MPQEESFFQSKYEAQAEFKEGKYVLTFQRVKIPLRQADELGALGSIDDGVERKIETNEDEIVIIAGPEKTLRPFSDLKQETATERLIFASNLIRFFACYRNQRVIPSCFPENIFFTPGFEPVFLHYGIKDSLPPVSYQEEESLRQVKAVVALLFDPVHPFDTYLKFDFAAKTTRFVKDILRCTTFQSMSGLVEKERRKEIGEEKRSIRLPKKRNRVKNGVLTGTVVLLIPLIILTVYAFIIQMPRQDLFEQSHEHYLQDQYSDVVTVLDPVDEDQMPKVVRYELAVSYVKNEALTESQQNTILNDLTLQSNPLYYRYWIQTGRGETSDALNTARSLNDRMLIAYGLLKEKAALQDNLSMNGKQKQERLQSIDSELKKYNEILGSGESSPADGAARPAGSETGNDGGSPDEETSGSSAGSTGSSTAPDTSAAQDKEGTRTGSSGTSGK